MSLPDYAFVFSCHAPMTRYMSDPMPPRGDAFECGIAKATEFPLAGGVSIHAATSAGTWVHVHVTPDDIWHSNDMTAMEGVPKPYYLPRNRVTSSVPMLVGVESLQGAIVVSDTKQTMRFVITIPTKVFEHMRQYAPNHDRNSMLSWKLQYPVRA